MGIPSLYVQTAHHNTQVRPGQKGQKGSEHTRLGLAFHASLLLLELNHPRHPCKDVCARGKHKHNIAACSCSQYCYCCQHCLLTKRLYIDLTTAAAAPAGAPATASNCSGPAALPGLHQPCAGHPSEQRCPTAAASSPSRAQQHSNTLHKQSAPWGAAALSDNRPVPRDRTTCAQFHATLLCCAVRISTLTGVVAAARVHMQHRNAILGRRAAAQPPQLQAPTHPHHRRYSPLTLLAAALPQPPAQPAPQTWGGTAHTAERDTDGW